MQHGARQSFNLLSDIQPETEDLPIDVFASCFEPALKTGRRYPTNHDVYEAMDLVTRWVRFAHENLMTGPEKREGLQINDPLLRIAQAIKDTPETSAYVSIRKKDLSNLQQNLEQLMQAGVMLMNSSTQGKNYHYTNAHGEAALYDMSKETFPKHMGRIISECYVNIAAKQRTQQFSTVAPDYAVA